MYIVADTSHRPVVILGPMRECLLAKLVSDWPNVFALAHSTRHKASITDKVCLFVCMSQYCYEVTTVKFRFWTSRTLARKEINAVLIQNFRKKYLNCSQPFIINTSNFFIGVARINLDRRRIY